jgi:sigma-54-interacting transcriptional regulator
MEENHMEGDRSRELVKSTHPQSSKVLAIEEDINLAALVNVPVLITGPAADCRELACELDRRSTSPVGEVEVIDCRIQNPLTALEQDLSANPKILLLQEVHALSPDDQLRLTRELEETGRPTTTGRRILASSSVPLFDRVVDQLFNEHLYYRLNVIHIVIP